MTCNPTVLPAADSIDFPALREKYRIEKERRLRKDGQAQYVRLSDEGLPDYSVDPYQPQIERAPIDEAFDVMVLGAGWGGIKSSYYLTTQGVSDIRIVDTAGDFGGGLEPRNGPADLATRDWRDLIHCTTSPSISRACRKARRT